MTARSRLNANGFIDAGDLLHDGRWCDGVVLLGQSAAALAAQMRAQDGHALFR